MTRLTVLGSTGSIGTSTLDVVRCHPNRFSIFALAAGRNTARLLGQIREFRPEVVAVATASDRERLLRGLADSTLARPEWPELLAGDQARVQVATAPAAQFVMSAIVGVAGLEATYEAVRCGKRVGLANKEVLVSGGQLVMEAVKSGASEMIPVDSEHNGAHQCLRAGNRADVSRLLLTASGGPFRNTPKESLESVTPGEALNHPTWKMGNRITIDSATLMNKGFEVIEACWLFGFQPSEVEVVIHPQSTVHALVEYTDGSVIAQISATDMRMPIQYALTYPERHPAPVPRIDWSQARHWDFIPPDLEKFPLLKIAYETLKAGGTASCILNAADEVGVEAFLEGRISFPGIATVVEETLAKVPVRQASSIRDILEVDRKAREVAAGEVSLRAAGAAAMKG